MKEEEKLREQKLKQEEERKSKEEQKLIELEKKCREDRKKKKQQYLKEKNKSENQEKRRINYLRNEEKRRRQEWNRLKRKFHDENEQLRRKRRQLEREIQKKKEENLSVYLPQVAHHPLCMGQVVMSFPPYSNVPHYCQPAIGTNPIAPPPLPPPFQVVAAPGGQHTQLPFNFV